MCAPHYSSITWLASLFAHIRYLSALVNPFALFRCVSQSARFNTAILGPAGNAIRGETFNNSNAERIKPSRVYSSGAQNQSATWTPGILIINADDWGRDRGNTDSILECSVAGRLSSVSAMVFMEDSERAAEIANKHGIDAGLHLNFTSKFSAANCSPQLIEKQEKLSRYLKRHRLARIVPNPILRGAFEYVVRAQLDEYRRLYGKDPEHLDGHHHMHLCANVLLEQLLPAGIIVRRNFSFLPGEKSFLNRHYRAVGDQILAKRCRTVDFFYSVTPVENVERLKRIFSLSQQHVVEVETHPVNPEERRLLLSDEILRLIGGQPIAPRFTIPS